MSVRVLVAIGVVLAMCAVMAVLVRRLRDVSLDRLLINLLFPFSQLCIVAFLLYCSIAFELPLWTFVSVAVVGLLCGLVDLVLFNALRESEERELSRERVRLLEEQLKAQQDYVQRLSADVNEARRIREEVADELGSVEALLDQHEAEQASRGLMKAVEMMDAGYKRYCNHQVVDALVSLKAALCDEYGIRLTLDLVLFDGISLSSVELCAVFSNMLDNAIHACVAIPEDERFIELKAQVEAGYLVVRMENSCMPSASGARGFSRHLRRARLAEHGWGLSILDTLATRHDGKLEITQEGSLFRTVVILKLSEAK